MNLVYHNHISTIIISIINARASLNSMSYDINYYSIEIRRLMINNMYIVAIPIAKQVSRAIANLHFMMTI
jgi:hypothetical protein